MRDADMAERRQIFDIEAAKLLAKTLREQPATLRRSPDELAREFGLPREFVRDAISELEISDEAQFLTVDNFVRPLRAWIWRLRNGFRKLTEDPIRFIVWSTAIAIACYTLLDRLVIRSTPIVGPAGDLNRPGSPYLLLIGGITFILHMACYFRHGMVRYPLQGGIIAWMASAPIALVFAWMGLNRAVPVRDVGLLISIAVAILFLCLAYTIFGSLSAVLGGLFWVRRQERERLMRTRQELLEQLFELEDRISSVDEDHLPLENRVFEDLLVIYRRRPMVLCFVLGFGLSLLEVFFKSAVLTDILRAGEGSMPLFGLAELGRFIVSVGIMATPGLFSKTFKSALLGELVLQVAALFPVFFPIPRVDDALRMELISTSHLLVTAALGFLTVLLGYGASKLELRAAYERRLSRNDPATLLTELMRIQWQLGAKVHDVCVMVVDVVRSTMLKASSDPFDAEYSFREYQAFVKEVTHRHNGHIHSTAGDGAVIAFTRPEWAFEAAQEIHRELPEFNKRRSRLSEPFRLRIGLHKGGVPGDLNQVRFTQVIDIAALAEELCPEGEICLTESVAKELPDRGLVPLNRNAFPGQPLFSTNFTGRAPEAPPVHS